MTSNNKGHVGWKFPVKADPKTGRIEISSYRDDIKESIRIILMTKKGERKMNPDFGCNIYKYMFDVINLTTLKQIEFEVENSIKTWEYRINQLEVHAEESKEEVGRIVINIEYTVKNSFGIEKMEYIYDTKN